jgi:hypothetical protein
VQLVGTIIAYAIAIFWIATIIYIAFRYCTGWNKKEEYTRPPKRPRDGTDGISAAHGAEVSYMPARRGGSKGGLPVSALGKSGRGRLGAKHAKDEE